jgi:hypothetical protein
MSATMALTVFPMGLAVSGSTGVFGFFAMGRI